MTPSLRCAGLARACQTGPGIDAVKSPRWSAPSGGRVLKQSWATACRPTVSPREGGHPDRNAQFEIHQQGRALIRRPRAAGHLGGHQEEGIGRAVHPRRAGNGSPRAIPRRCNVHDFPDPRVGKAIPYGVYDLGWDWDGSTSASITTRPASPSRASASGGSRWVRSRTPRRSGC